MAQLEFVLCFVGAQSVNDRHQCFLGIILNSESMWVLGCPPCGDTIGWESAISSACV